MKRFILICCMISVSNWAAHEFESDLSAIASGPSTYKHIVPYDKDEFESKPINYHTTHFSDESLQSQKFSKKSKESVKKSKNFDNQPKTARHSIQKTLIFHDDANKDQLNKPLLTDTSAQLELKPAQEFGEKSAFDFRPISFVDLESNKKPFQKRERSKILSKQAKENINRLAKRYEFKKANSSEALEEQQRKIDAFNALLDQAVAEMNFGD